MKWLDDYRMRLVLDGFVAAIVLGGGSVKADFTFGTPTNPGPTVNSSSHDGDPSILSDGLELYFVSYNRPGGFGNFDIWVSTRTTTNDPWGEPANLGSAINSPSFEGQAKTSADDLSLFFVSDRPGGSGNIDIWISTRATTNDLWGKPVNLGPAVNSASEDGLPCVSADELELYFYSNRPGGYGGRDLWVTTRATKEDPWSEPVNLGSTVNSPANEASAEISDDGLMLFFASQRTGGYGSRDLWVTRRKTRDDAWGLPVNIGPKVNTAYGEFAPSISADGLWLYFSDYPTPWPGGFGDTDIWQAPIISIVDFNGDGIVDSVDMCIMVDHWGEDYPLCDIGPMPWGNGIVDVQDLTVLAENLFEEVSDPTLIAHWPLDETEGDIAQDSAGGNDGFVIGDPVWQPDGGQADGALELDGVDDCIITDTGPNSAEQPFSVITWIKGGTPGQVIISQPGGVNWLALDADGNLMTELKGSGRSAAALFSQSVITDEQWHRIGLVWDGSQRTLFVDDVTVAEDIQDSLGFFGSGLYVGVGKNYTSGTFFSGLIDDVRIYNRAVSP